MTATPNNPRSSWREALAVYLKPRVLIVLFLGFSAGLPLALSGSTLLVWMREAGVDLGTIGLFALVGTPYTIKFLWAPLVDALDVPVLSRWLGRRRGWLVFSQLLLMAAIVFLAFCDPGDGALAGRVRRAAGRHRLGHAGHRDRRVPRREPATPASRPPAWRPTSRPIASACWSRPPARCSSSAASRCSGFGQGRAPGPPAISRWRRCVLIGIVTTLIATEPEKSAAAARSTPRMPARIRCTRVLRGRRRRVLANSSPATWRSSCSLFVVLYKFCDAFAGAMTAPFVIDLGFSRNDYAAIVKGVGLAATLIGGFAGGFVARALSAGRPASGSARSCRWRRTSCSPGRPRSGTNYWALTAAIIAENFTGAIGTVIFVAYLSALCQNPLHTATQFALLTALAAVGRTYLSSGAGYVARGDRLAGVLRDQRAGRAAEPRAARVAAGARAFRPARAGEASVAARRFASTADRLGDLRPAPP